MYVIILCSKASDVELFIDVELLWLMQRELVRGKGIGEKMQLGKLHSSQPLFACRTTQTRNSDFDFNMPLPGMGLRLLIDRLGYQANLKPRLSTHDFRRGSIREASSEEDILTVVQPLADFRCEESRDALYHLLTVSEFLSQAHERLH